MANHKGPTSDARVAYDAMVEVLDSALNGDTRGQILNQISKPGDLRESMRRLRTAMRSHAFRTDAGRLLLDRQVKALDSRTRREGFYVLQAWDPDRHRFTSDTNPVLLLDYVARTVTTPRSERHVLATLLDCYFLYVAALLVMRIWDQEDPNRSLDQVSDLLRHLQGPSGSGHQFVADAESLLLLATSQYQPDEAAYDRLLEKVRTLDEHHQTILAVTGAANLGSHLRWGFQFMYRRDPERMRSDNIVDYPWLLFSLSTLIGEYTRTRENAGGHARQESVVESLLNGLTADPWAFTGEAPSCLSNHRSEHAHLRERLSGYADDLAERFEPHRPAGRSYSPIGFQFNFLHNTLVAKIIVTLLQDSVPNLSLNTLFTGAPADVPRSRSPELLARVLMDFSGAEPSRLGARGAVLTVYDPSDARRSYETAVQTLRGMNRSA